MEKETMSTAAFYEELAAIDFSKEGPRLRKFCVNIDLQEFAGLVEGSKTLVPVASSDGIVSHVKESLGSDPLDNSQSSRYFLLHTDGQYLPKVPEMVILHCANPGIGGMPTVFADTIEILDVLKKTGRLEEAKEYVFVFKNKKGVEFRRPLVERHPVTGVLLMNIAIESPQCHLEPLSGGTRSDRDAERFYALIAEIAKHHLNYIVHEWKKNDLVVFDNLRLVHGRGLPADAPPVMPDNERHLHRMWLSRKPKPAAPLGVIMCLIKPDAFEKRDDIIKELRDAGLDVIRTTSQRLAESFLRKLYCDVPDPVMEATLKHYLSGPSEIVLIRNGMGAIEKILGAAGSETNPSLCSSSSIRFRYGVHSSEDIRGGLLYWRNALHRPKTAVEASRDLELFADFYPGIFDPEPIIEKSGTTNL